MYGAFSGLSFGLVIVAVLLVIALAVAASPLLAAIVAVVIGAFFLTEMTMSRQRSETQEGTEGGAPDAHAPRRAAHRRPSGGPAQARARRRGE